MTSTGPSGTAAPSDDRPWTALRGELPAPADPAEAADVLWQQLAAQLRWYDRAATLARRAHQALQVGAVVLAAAVTVLAAVRAPAPLTAGVAAGVVVLQGVQQVFQFQTNWISYRAVAEDLRRHAFRYVAGVEPYADPATRRGALALVVHELTSSESATWADRMRRSAAAPATDPR